MNADGSNPVDLSNNAAAERHPSFSPDGTKIAFVSNLDGNNEIYVMNADGTNQTRLTNDPASDFYPAWGFLPLGTPTPTPTPTPSVTAEISGLMSTISSSGLLAGTKTSLNAKLQDVLNEIQVGDIARACSDLQDFINKVNNQNGRKIALGLANSLVDTATQIMRELGCGQVASNHSDASQRFYFGLMTITESVCPLPSSAVAELFGSISPSPSTRNR
jgi:hypothetical protein